MRVRPLHISCLKESPNALSYRHLTFHMILSPLIVLLVVEKVKLHRPSFMRVPVSETENVEVLNAALFMTQNAAARIRPLRSRIGRSPWSFPSLNLSRSYNNWPQSGGRLKYFVRLVAIGFAYSRNIRR